MPRTQNIFHNLVTDENSTTELLCSLMRFPAFRQTAIRILLGVAADVSFEQIDTQADLAGHGRADLLLRTDQLCAIVEVKVNPWQALTPRQELDYIRYLSGQNQPQKVLAFLVPDAWLHFEPLKAILAES